MDRIAKYRYDGEKYMMGGCLVQDDTGRFRVPGSKYTTLKTIAPSRGESQHNRSRSSISSSKSNRKNLLTTPVIQPPPLRSSSNQSTRSNKVRSRSRLRDSNASNFFEDRCAPIPKLNTNNHQTKHTDNNNNINSEANKRTSKSKGFIVKRNI